MTVYAYLRVSTTRQAEEGESLDVQGRQVEGYATMHGFKIGRTFVERGVSGAVPLADRPQGVILFGLLQPGDVVVSAKLDRMFRSANDALSTAEQLKKKGVHLHLIDLGGDVVGNGHAKMFFTIVAAFAEAEKDRIRERVQQMKKDQKDRNKFLGGRRPFGYRVTEAGTLEPVPEEQAAIAKAKRMRAKNKSLRDIAAALQKDGHTISHEGVSRILKETPKAAA